MMWQSLIEKALDKKVLVFDIAAHPSVLTRRLIFLMRHVMKATYSCEMNFLYCDCYEFAEEPQPCEIIEIPELDPEGLWSHYMTALGAAGAACGGNHDHSDKYIIVGTDKKYDECEDCNVILGSY